MNTRITLTFVLFAFVATTVAASTPVPGRQPYDRDELVRPNEVTRNHTVEIAEVLEDRQLRVKDEYGVHLIQIPEEAILKAQAKRDFDGRKKLAFADLSKGQNIKVTFRADTGKILRIKVLKSTA